METVELSELAKEKIETLLKQYRSLKAKVEIELNRRYPEYSIDSVSFVETHSKTNAINSEVENYVVDKYSLDEDIITKIQIVQIIRAAYDSLTTHQKALVRERYFEDKSYEKVGQAVHLHKDTVSKKINHEILPALENVGILEAWELWKETNIL